MMGSKPFLEVEKSIYDRIMNFYLISSKIHEFWNPSLKIDRFQNPFLKIDGFGRTHLTHANYAPALAQQQRLNPLLLDRRIRLAFTPLSPRALLQKQKEQSCSSSLVLLAVLELTKDCHQKSLRLTQKQDIIKQSAIFSYDYENWSKITKA